MVFGDLKPVRVFVCAIVYTVQRKCTCTDVSEQEKVILSKDPITSRAEGVRYVFF